MKYTDRLENAIRFAARKHHGQMRKDSEPLPYLTHLIAAAILVSEVTDDEDVVIATLLHDTLEDTETSERELKDVFGERVLKFVKAVTLEREKDGKMLSWKEQRELGFENLQRNQNEALFVALADKVHNGVSRVLSARNGDHALMEKFAMRRADYIDHNERLLSLARERIGENILTSRLQEIIDQEKTL